MKNIGRNFLIISEAGIISITDLKKAIDGYANVVRRFRENGVFGYTVPLKNIALRGAVGIFADTRYMYGGQRVTVAGQVDRWVGLTNGDSVRVEQELYGKVFNPYRHWNSVALEEDGNLLLVSDLQKIGLQLPLCSFIPQNGSDTPFWPNDPVPCIRLPCLVFAKKAFLTFDRSGGAVSHGWNYIWSGSFHVKNFVASVEYIQRSPRFFFGREIDTDTKQYGLDKRLVVNFMALIIDD